MTLSSSCLTSRLGLTGGIGSGKSTVAAQLVELGALLVDTDAISRALTAAGGAALPALARAFGADLIAADGALDRNRMRSLVFDSPERRRELEGILHPMIGAEALRQAEAAGHRPVVFDVPLLGENSVWRARVQRVLVVDCHEETQVARVMARNGWPRETVEGIMAQQLSRTRRRRVADAVIFNEGLTLEALRNEVQQVWQWWTGGAPCP